MLIFPEKVEKVISVIVFEVEQSQLFSVIFTF